MPSKLLVAYSQSSTHVQTTLDYLSAVERCADFDVSYLHVTHEARPTIDLNSYDIVFHSYCARLCFPGYVSPTYCHALRDFKGLKVLAVQDEYNATNILKDAIKKLGFHIVLTCVPQSALEYVYPKAEFPTTKFITVLTGYVPDHALISEAHCVPLAQRPIVLGYRGRDVGAHYGRLGFEKFEVGRRLKEQCEKRGIPHDIAMDEASRIYGPQWLEFIGSCRAMLGSESGSNVFDFDGSILKTYQRITVANGGRPPSYIEFSRYVAKRDTEIDMGQISPRVFECALKRTPMALITGRYSGAIQPYEHYIPIAQDFSNLDEVFARLSDVRGLELMAERTYHHLIASGRYSYGTVWRMLSDEFRAQLDRWPGRAGLIKASEQSWLPAGFARCGMFDEAATSAPKLPDKHFVIKDCALALLKPTVRYGIPPQIVATVARHALQLRCAALETMLRLARSLEPSNATEPKATVEAHELVPQIANRLSEVQNEMAGLAYGRRGTSTGDRGGGSDLASGAASGNDDWRHVIRLGRYYSLYLELTAPVTQLKDELRRQLEIKRLQQPGLAERASLALVSVRLVWTQTTGSPVEGLKTTARRLRNITRTLTRASKPARPTTDPIRAERATEDGSIAS